MAVFKCKMCGGTLEVRDGSKICECEYCGSEQTIPSVNEENLQNLFNRANILRMKAEFDKAADVYERIIQADGTEAEAYWGLVLCKYGVEYVEDPATLKRIPTCHRTSFEAVVADEDYRKAIECADMAQKNIYEAEAKAIDDIQKGILDVVSSETPYDVFICYKEADESGKKTVDSVIANDIYHQLTQEGFKVFYAAITLEEKLGSEYEPYIFSALNSAKVMLVLGTKPAYFDTVWVKNEWSRFMKLMRNDRSRTLIPCYRDMDAYELPEEFAHLQAQDMSKIGFINDVIRGIKKLIIKPDQNTSVKSSPVESSGSTEDSKANALIRRAFISLEDGDWKKADDFCEQALNLDPENSEAYVGKLMARLHVCRKDDLSKLDHLFDDEDNYKKAVRFGDTFLDKAIMEIVHNIYEKAMRLYESPTSPKDLTDAKNALNSISKWTDISTVLERVCNKEKEWTESLVKLRKEIKSSDFKFLNYNNGCLIGNSLNRGVNEVFIDHYKLIEEDDDIVSVVEMAQGCGTVKLKSDGTVIIKSKEKYANVENLIGITKIFAEFGTIVGLRKNGTVVAAVPEGKQMFDVKDWTGICDIDIGDDCIIGLRNDGTVVATDHSLQSRIFIWRNIASICYINNCITGLRNDGTVVTTNNMRQNIVKSWNNIVSIFCTYTGIIGITSDGTAVYAGRIGATRNYVYWEDVADIICVADRHSLGLKTDGTVVTDARTFFKGIENWSNIISIGGFAYEESDDRLYCAYGLKADGTVITTDEKLNKCVKDWKLFDPQRSIELQVKEFNRKCNEQIVENLQSRVADLQRRIADLQSRIDELMLKKSEAETELAGLKGMFTGKRRKEIEQQLSDIDKKIKELQNAKLKLNTEKQDYKIIKGN